MSLVTINKEELKNIFSDLEEAFNEVGIDYYLIGALARETWYSIGDMKPKATTKDVDFAVLVGDKSQYEQMRQYLELNKEYTQSNNNAFVIIAPDGTAIDLFPFGAIEIDDAVVLESEGLTSINVNGFREVYNNGTLEMEVVEGHSFHVATIPSIVLLKFIAYDDRPEKRIGDADDIINLITSYFDLEANLIYEEHSDLFLDENEALETEQIAAIVIGREMKKVIGENKELYKRVFGIIAEHTSKKENSKLVRRMAEESGKYSDDVVLLLNYILKGLEK